MAAAARARPLLFSMAGSIAEGIVVEGDAIVRRTASGHEPLIPLSSIRLLGRHLMADVARGGGRGVARRRRCRRR